MSSSNYTIHKFNKDGEVELGTIHAYTIEEYRLIARDLLTYCYYSMPCDCKKSHKELNILKDIAKRLCYNEEYVKESAISDIKNYMQYSKFN